MGPAHRCMRIARGASHAICQSPTWATALATRMRRSDDWGRCSSPRTVSFDTAEGWISNRSLQRADDVVFGKSGWPESRSSWWASTQELSHARSLAHRATALAPLPPGHEADGGQLPSRGRLRPGAPRGVRHGHHQAAPEPPSVCRPWHWGGRQSSPESPDARRALSIIRSRRSFARR